MIAPHCNDDGHNNDLPDGYWEKILKKKRILKLYDWQIDCLQLKAVKEKKNLIYSLPTGGGKTLIAEILIVKELLVHNKNAIFILPFRAIVQEKITSLASLGLEFGFLVEEYAGNKGMYPPKKRRRKKSVFVCTIEKALGLINSLIEEKRILEIGLVVIDELHFIGENKRGAILENIILKLLFFPDSIQILSMSATIGNLEEIACFLNAETYQKDFRATELSEHIKVKDELFLVNHKEYPSLCLKKICSYDSSKNNIDVDGIGNLVDEVVPDKSCLVFCQTKSNCENVALMICETLSRRSSYEWMNAEKSALIKALRSEGNGIICPVLKKTIPFGVVYHHSGLTNAERKLIEEAFLSSTINCICCTSTLAAGINLPAQRVIIRSPYVGKSFITLSQYRQMIGRAGRAGLESSGESFLICQPTDTEKVGLLLSSKMERCCSQLLNNDFSCFVMSLISLELVKDKNSIIDVMKKSLLYMQSHLLDINIEQYLQNTLGLLVSNNVIEIHNEKFILKSFGKAAVKGNLPFEVARELYEDLTEAQNSLVLVNDLHLLYLVTPYSVLEDVNPAFDVIWNVFSDMNNKNMQVARTVGINEAIVHRILAQRSIKTLPEKILKRFFVSLILHELWTGQNVWNVSKKYKLSRGFVYNLLSTSSSFSSSVIRFCEVMVELKCFVNLLGHFPQQLSFCCSPELLPLLELPAVNKGRAKLLFNAGFKDFSSIAKSDPQTLANSVYYLPIKHAKKIIEGAKLLQLITFETLQDEFESLREGIGV